MQRALRHPRNRHRDVKVSRVELDESIASALCHARCVTLFETSLREAMLAVCRRPLATPITLYDDTNNTNNVAVFEWFLHQNIMLPYVTLSIDCAVLKNVSLSSAKATLQRLVVRQSSPQEKHSQVIAEYARRTSMPIWIYSSFIFAYLN